MVVNLPQYTFFQPTRKVSIIVTLTVEKQQYINITAVSYLCKSTTIVTMLRLRGIKEAIVVDVILFEFDELQNS